MGASISEKLLSTKSVFLESLERFGQFSPFRPLNDDSFRGSEVELYSLKWWFGTLYCSNTCARCTEEISSPEVRLCDRVPFLENIRSKASVVRDGNLSEIEIYFTKLIN